MEGHGQQVEGAACLTGAGDAPEREVPVHPFVRALQFDLVTDKLVSLINFEDMKALSAVSRGCLQGIRKTSEFSKRARFIICKAVVNSEVLRESVYQWKHISLDLSLPIEVVELVEDMLQFVTSITLRLPGQKDDSRIVEYLSAILKRTPNLQSLELDAIIFNYVLIDLFADVGVQSLLTNLQCLAIQSHCDRPTAVCYLEGCDDDEESPFQRNFLQISLVPLNLKKFVFGKVITISGSESSHAKFIPNIIEAAKKTLEDLELHLNVWKISEMTHIRCPKLKRLVLSGNGDEKDPNMIKAFLKNQPPLEELVIVMMKVFPLSILLLVQGEGMMSKMKKFHIHAKTFSETTTTMDWRFLETMSKLKDFHIRKPASFRPNPNLCGFGEDILAKLPVGVEKISIQGFDPFWRELYPVIGNIGVLLGRFENLTEVNLLRSANSVTDEGLQSIITNCKKLTALTFTHCPEVTDFGISGIRKSEDGGIDERVGVSLANLKGLTSLKIRSCANISPECLLQVVQFKFLRHFDYYRNVVLQKSFLLQIARQNPCLEQVALHITNYENDADYSQQLTREVKEINPRLHLIEILEHLDWEDDDSDCDASSRHEDGDSDFSGGGHHMHGFDDFDDDYDSVEYDFDEVDDDDVDYDF